jgi:kinesin family member 3B
MTGTLRYANRAKQIKNKPKINEDPKDAMLREFQEEIMRLRAQLAGRGGEGGSNGESKHSSGSRRRKKGGRTIVEEKIVIKREGIEKDIFEQLKNKSREEQDRIMQDLAEKKRRIEMKKVKTEQEAKELEKRLREEERQRMETLQRQREIEDKLKEVEKKVFMGGEELDRASAEAREFKRKKIELKEQKRREELMARQLAAQEEANIMIQEEYASLHEEAHDKTQKLKKLYTKYQQQKSEVKDLQEEFNRERETILEDIRMLNKQLKLNEFILQRYVPEDAVKRIETWATYDEVKDAWSIRRLDYAGNNQKRFQKRVRDNASSGTTSPLSTDHLYFQYDKDSESGISVMRRRKKKSVSSSSDVDVSKKKLKKKKKKKSSRKKKERYRDGK